MSRHHHRCAHVIDTDATVNDVPHQTISCATIIPPDETYCAKHKPLHQPSRSSAESES